jgi:hypothetical protein
VSAGGSDLAVLRGRGDGTFAAPTRFRARGGACVVADLDADGLPDLVAASSTGVVAVLGHASPDAPTCRRHDDCDDDYCTRDACVDGTRTHRTLACNDGNPCTVDVCVDDACAPTPVTCDDGDPCTDDACTGGSCVSTPRPGIQRAQCLIDQAPRPLRGDDPIAPSLDRAIATRLDALRVVVHGAEQRARRRAKLLLAAERRVAAIQRKVRKAARKGRLSAPCAARIDAVMVGVEEALSST